MSKFIEVLKNIPAGFESYLLTSLADDNESQVGKSDYKPLAIALKGKDDRPIGGLSGSTSYGWLYIQYMFVPNEMRGVGFGKELLRLAELEARDRGCHGVWLETFSFQSKAFYLRQGYSEFGVLRDYPRDSSRHFMHLKLN